MSSRSNGRQIQRLSAAEVCSGSSLMRVSLCIEAGVGRRHAMRLAPLRCSVVRRPRSSISLSWRTTTRRAGSRISWLRWWDRRRRLLFLRPWMWLRRGYRIRTSKSSSRVSRLLGIWRGKKGSRLSSRIGAEVAHDRAEVDVLVLACADAYPGFQQGHVNRLSIRECSIPLPQLRSNPSVDWQLAANRDLYCTYNITFSPQVQNRRVERLIGSVLKQAYGVGEHYRTCVRGDHAIDSLYYNSCLYISSAIIDYIPLHGVPLELQNWRR